MHRRKKNPPLIESNNIFFPQSQDDNLFCSVWFGTCLLGGWCSPFFFQNAVDEGSFSFTIFLLSFCSCSDFWFPSTVQSHKIKKEILCEIFDWGNKNAIMLWLHKLFLLLYSFLICLNIWLWNIIIILWGFNFIKGLIPDC